MASKWLRAFLETEEPSASLSVERADSVNSAVRPSECPVTPPIGAKGTIGTENERASGTAEPQELLALKALSAWGEEIEQAPLCAPAIDELDERAALIEVGAGVPRRWAEGFAALSSMPAPIGFSPERWQRIVDAAGIFLDKWAAAASRCGWSDLDVFGCDPDRPDARFDAMGLVLLLDRCEVVGIDDDGADLVTATGARQRYRRRPLPSGTVPLWQLMVPRGAA